MDAHSCAVLCGSLTGTTTTACRRLTVFCAANPPTTNSPTKGLCRVETERTRTRRHKPRARCALRDGGKTRGPKPTAKDVKSESTRAKKSSGPASGVAQITPRATRPCATALSTETRFRTAASCAPSGGSTTTHPVRRPPSARAQPTACSAWWASTRTRRRRRRASP